MRTVKVWLMAAASAAALLAVASSAALAADRKLDFDENAPVLFQADRLVYDTDGKTVRLEGNVEGDSAEGHAVPTSLRTASLELVPEQNIARTDDPVTLTQPGIMQTGVGFEANLRTQRYKFLSQVKTRYEPNAAR